MINLRRKKESENLRMISDFHQGIAIINNDQYVGENKEFSIKTSTAPPRNTRKFVDDDEDVVVKKKKTRKNYTEDTYCEFDENIYENTLRPIVDRYDHNKCYDVNSYYEICNSYDIYDGWY